MTLVAFGAIESVRGLRQCRHCAMFNQSRPRLWFAGFVLSGLFPIESLGPACCRLGGHWHMVSHFRFDERCLLRVRLGFLRVKQA